MKLKLATFIIILCIPLFNYAQDYSLFAGARSDGLANASVSVLDVFSTFHNPSLLAWNEENWVGISGRNNFSVNSMNSAFSAGAFNTNTGNVGFSFLYNGNNSYYNVKAGAYYAQSFGETFSASVGLNLYQYRLKGYDASFAFTSDIGLTAKLEKAVLGFYWGNLNNGEWSGTFTENIPNYLRFGGTYYFEDNFLLTLEGIQDLGADFGVRGGLEYVIEEVIAVRGGYSSLPKQTSMGISVYLNQFSIDMAGSWHPMLGFTPQVGATYKW